MLVDSHAHLNFSDYADKLDQVIADAQTGGIEKIINIGTSLKDSEGAIKLAGQYAGLYATVGIHPIDNLDANTENTNWVEFERLAQLPKVVAIGETGLDYSRIEKPTSAPGSDETNRQKKLFIRQIEIAKKLDLALSIHIRDAQSDVMSEFTEILHDSRGVFHCFSGNREYLNFILEKLPGFYLSFAGNVTFKNAKQLQELAKLVPLSRLLFETDCPFLAPEPLRGTQNVPANVKITASKLAELQRITLKELAQKVTENCQRLFEIRPAA